MALMLIEFYTAAPASSNNPDGIEGFLISSTEDSTLTTTPEHAAVPDNATYAVVITDTDSYIEVGSGNQDVASGRRQLVLSGMARGFFVKPTDTISYRSVV